MPSPPHPLIARALQEGDLGVLRDVLSTRIALENGSGGFNPSLVQVHPALGDCKDIALLALRQKDRDVLLMALFLQTKNIRFEHPILASVDNIRSTILFLVIDQPDAIDLLKTLKTYCHPKTNLGLAILQELEWSGSTTSNPRNTVHDVFDLAVGFVKDDFKDLSAGVPGPVYVSDIKDFCADLEDYLLEQEVSSNDYFLSQLSAEMLEELTTQIMFSAVDRSPFFLIPGTTIEEFSHPSHLRADIPVNTPDGILCQTLLRHAPASLLLPDFFGRAASYNHYSNKGGSIIVRAFLELADPVWSDQDLLLAQNPQWTDPSMYGPRLRTLVSQAQINHELGGLNAPSGPKAKM